MLALAVHSDGLWGPGWQRLVLHRPAGERPVRGPAEEAVHLRGGRQVEELHASPRAAEALRMSEGDVKQP